MISDSELETLYAAVAPLPIGEQRVALRDLPESTRAALWAYHLRKFRDEHPMLSDVQRAVIDEGIELLARPDFFLRDDGQHEATRLAFEAHKKRGEAAFPPELLVRIFFRI